VKTKPEEIRFLKKRKASCWIMTMDLEDATNSGDQDTESLKALDQATSEPQAFRKLGMTLRNHGRFVDPEHLIPSIEAAAPPEDATMQDALHHCMYFVNLCIRVTLRSLLTFGSGWWHVLSRYRCVNLCSRWLM
jgi:hypothetical protein